MTIKKMEATVIETRDISPTAREIVFSLPEELGFIPGSFVNVFASVNEQMTRRAFSISSDCNDQRVITISVRKIPGGAISPLFWHTDIIGKKFEIMGPLGLNTAEKMSAARIILIGFGIGVSPIKSLAHHFSKSPAISELSILTGSRNQDEVLYDDFFNQTTALKGGIYRPVVSGATAVTWPARGHIQDNIADINFNDSSVYVCGQEKACEAVVATIKNTHPSNCQLLIEGFH